MIVTGIDVENFRAFSKAHIDLDRGVNRLVGPNGVGKTTVLEAISISLTGMSFRTRLDRELIRYGQEYYRVELRADDVHGGHHFFVASYGLGGGKVLKINGVERKWRSSGVTRPYVQVFYPDKLELVKGAPVKRRAHIDRFIEALWPSRSDLRMRYRKALVQRNTILQSISGAIRHEEVDAWDREIAVLGMEIINNREEAIRLIDGLVGSKSNSIGMNGALSVEYRPSLNVVGCDEYADQLKACRQRDTMAGYTTKGPHRDEIRLIHNGKDLARFGSQGEQRLALLSLLFSEGDILNEVSGHSCLLLLDDVMSELDGERRKTLLGELKKYSQVVITSAIVDENEVDEEAGFCQVLGKGLSL